MSPSASNGSYWDRTKSFVELIGTSVGQFRFHGAETYASKRLSNRSSPLYANMKVLKALCIQGKEDECDVVTLGDSYDVQYVCTINVNFQEGGALLRMRRDEAENL
jgi:hypothetical protein